jgi:hypothetical protein
LWTTTAVHSSAKLWNGISCAFIALLLLLTIHSDALPHPHGRLTALPRVTLWAWERREDLHTIDSHRFAVAYLDQTLTIGLTVRAQPRHDALFFPSSATRTAVVRIEAPSTALLNDENRDDAIRAIMTTARDPGIAALQIDFDATRSQRSFYRDLLTNLRSQLPPSLPLSMTALASWCSWDNWIRDLPVDEAVPMMFRMEPDHRRAPPSLDDFQIREPLCRTSVGISTDESWPSNFAGKRIYVFPDHGWRNSPPAELARRLP